MAWLLLLDSPADDGLSGIESGVGSKISNMFNISDTTPYSDHGKEVHTMVMYVRLSAGRYHSVNTT
jgi:hypothetical protein